MWIWDLIKGIFTDGVEPLKSRHIHHWSQPIDFVRWDDMVFEGREKNYGSYLLRKHQPWYLFTSLGLVGGVFLYGVFLPVWFLAKEDMRQNRPVTIVCGPMYPDLSQPPHDKDHYMGMHKEPSQVSFQIPLPSSKVDTSFKGTGNDQINQVKDSTVIAGDPSVSFEKTICINITDTLSFPPIIDVLSPIKDEDDYLEKWLEGYDEPVIPFCGSVDAEPMPINLDEIWKLITYPETTRDPGPAGLFVVRLLVDKKGRYKKHKVLVSIHPILDREIEKHLPKLRFVPAIQGGRPIDCWVGIPFHIKLLN